MKRGSWGDCVDELLVFKFLYMNTKYKLIFSRISTYVIILFIILIILAFIIYFLKSNISITLYIWNYYTIDILFKIISWLIVLWFGLYKWFRRWEEMNENNEMNRMKSHLFNNLSCPEFKEIINLSYYEIYNRYEKLEARKTMQIIDDKVSWLSSPTR